MRDQRKENARKHFDAGEIAEGFACLESLTADELCVFLFKHNEWITEGPVSDYFWQTYLPVCARFDEIISGEHAINLLHHYFSKNREPCDALLQRLAAHYPKLLIKTIRVNRAFVRAHHSLSLVFLKDHSDAYLKYHYYVFYELGVQHLELYNTFARGVYALAQHDPADIVHHVALWSEEKRYVGLLSDIALSHGFRRGVEVIGLFFDYYAWVQSHDPYTWAHSQTLSAYEYTPAKARDSREKVLDECLRAYEANELHKQPVWVCLDAAATYWDHVTGILNTYCFDLNYEVVQDQHELILKPQSMDDYNSRRAEGAKLEYWYQHYFKKGRDACPDTLKAVELSMATGGDEGLEISLEKEARFMTARMVADYFSLSGSRARNFSVEDLIRVAGVLNNHAFERFVDGLNYLHLRKQESWLQNVKEAQEAYRSAGMVGFMSSDEINDLFRSVPGNALPQEYFHDLKALLTKDPHTTKRYDRFKPSINLFATPFIYINRTYLSFNTIMGESRMMSEVLVNLLDKKNTWRSKVQKQETEHMEAKLAALFRQAGFTRVMFGRKYHEKKSGIAGDMDVVVYEEGSLLCLELKRNKFRVLLDEIWDESRLGLLTASLQLDKTEKFLVNHFPGLQSGLLKDLNIATDDFSQIRFYSFIVSTSFEQDHRLINDRHLKISLFELEEVLKDYISRKEKPALEELITQITRDTYWETKLGAIEQKTVEESSFRFEISRLAVNYFP